jgi:hypothetical protein
MLIFVISMSIPNWFLVLPFLLNYLLAQTIPQDSIGQEHNSATWQVKWGIQKAFILAHRTTMEHLVLGYPTQLECAVQNLKSLHFSDSNFLKPPVWGISITSTDLKNPQILGKAFTISPSLDFIVNNNIHLPFNIQLAFGAAYITKYWTLDNFKNDAIGTPLNAYVRFRWYWQFKFLKHLTLEPGFTFSHMSNGRFKNPNLGINLIGIQILVKKSTSKVIPVLTKNSIRTRPRVYIQCVASVGVNQQKLQAPLKAVGHMGLSCQYRNKKNAYAIGLDAFYDQQYQDIIKDEGLLLNPLNYWRSTLFLGYTFHAGPIAFPLELGYYIYQKSKPDEPIVNRLGVRYTFKNNIMMHWAIRAHYAVAYNFEYGIGYRFSDFRKR